MNNYSWLQQKLHHIALSSNFMRETAFDIESTFFSPQVESSKHVFVAGLARSGTTILLNAIHESNVFASLSYKDMPFVLAPNLWSKIYPNKKNIDLVERAHKDGIKISTESPEAFEEVFWKTFDSKSNESIRKFKIFVQLITLKYNKTRYLSKNNQNIKRLELISNIYPSSIIFIPYRNPIQQAYSLLQQHKKFNEYAYKDKFVSDYMKWIGHTEFGPNYIPLNNKDLSYKNDLNVNHWLEQWYLVYKNCYETLCNYPNIHFISYEHLCRSDNYWYEIIKLLSIDNPLRFHFRESIKDADCTPDDSLSQKAYHIYNQLNQLID